MTKYSGHDDYLDPASGVLKNRFGITDPATLEQTEAILVSARSYELIQTPLQGRLDLEHLQAIHRYLFGDVYEWAGQLRTIDISKGGNRFAHHAHIRSAAASVFKKLARIHEPPGTGGWLLHRMGRRGPRGHATSLYRVLPGRYIETGRDHLR